MLKSEILSPNCVRCVLTPSDLGDFLGLKFAPIPGHYLQRNGQTLYWLPSGVRQVYLWSRRLADGCSPFQWSDLSTQIALRAYARDTRDRFQERADDRLASVGGAKQTLMLL